MDNQGVYLSLSVPGAVLASCGGGGGGCDDGVRQRCEEEAGNALLLGVSRDEAEWQVRLQP